MANPRIERTARIIKRASLARRTRSGQELFNALPPDVQNVVCGTMFDPFPRIMSVDELVSWMDNHLIFRGTNVIAVFNNNEILWEKDEANGT